MALHVEADHRLRPLDCFHRALVHVAPHPAFGDVGSQLDDTDHLARSIENRIVGRLDPHGFTILAHPPKLLRVELPASQIIPEGRVVRRVSLALQHEHAVLAANDLLGLIAHHPAEIFIGLEDGGIRLEADDGVGLVQRVEHGAILRREDFHVRRPCKGTSADWPGVCPIETGH